MDRVVTANDGIGWAGRLTVGAELKEDCFGEPVENVRLWVVEVVTEDIVTSVFGEVSPLIESRNEVSATFLLERDLALVACGRAGVPEQGCCL